MDGQKETLRTTKSIAHFYNQIMKLIDLHEPLKIYEDIVAFHHQLMNLVDDTFPCKGNSLYVYL